MMRVSSEKYNINIEVDSTYTLNSADNRYFSKVFKLHEDINRSYTKTFSISIVYEDKEINIALVGDYYSDCENCAVLNNDILIILMNNKVAFIELKNINLLKVIEVSSFCCFSISKFKVGYIVHGELDIVYINDNWEKEWSFSARDIFTTPDGSDVFEIEEDKIRIKDWEGYIYTLDSKGKLISETKDI